MGDDVTVKILEQIRDGISALDRNLGDRIERVEQGVSQRLDQTNQRLDQTNQRLERVEHGLLDLGKFMRRLARDQAKHERFHIHHVDLLDKDVQDLKARRRKVEDRLGS